MKTAKLVLVGESGVGKTSLTRRLSNGTFDKFECSTIGAAYSSIRHQYEDGEVVCFNVWDTAGQERFHALIPMYYRGADAALVCVDRNTSDEQRRYWIDDARAHCDNVIVVGMRCDMGRAADPVEVQTSAATSEGCEELLRFVARYASESKQSGAMSVQSPGSRVDGRWGACCART